MNSEKILTHQCICGSFLFKVLATFEDFELTTHSCDMWCYECGREYQAPTPLDRPEEYFDA